jgi:hypothetical protein
MRLINKHKNLAKYDYRENILYLNHNKETSHDINELISKCFELNLATKRLKANNGLLKFTMQSSHFMQLYQHDDHFDM